MVEVRGLKEDDIDILSEVFAEAWNSMNVGEKWTKERAREYLLYWKKRGSIFLVAEEEGEIVGGFVSEIKPWWSDKMLNDGELFVHPRRQGKGIGKMLFLEMLIRAKKEGAQHVSFFTYKGSKAHKWYMRLGMRDVNEWVIVEGRIDDVIKNLEQGRTELKSSGKSSS